MMKRYIIILSLLMGIATIISGCSDNSKNKEVIDPATPGYIKLYFINPESTKLVAKDYVLELEEKRPVESKIQNIINALSTQKELASYKAVINDSYNYLGCTVYDTYVSLNFDDGYTRMEASTEVLVRAALVKSVIQLPEVSSVEITVNGQPIADGYGQVIGIMNEDSFVEKNGSDGSYNQYGDVTLYFANTKGNKLKEYPLQMEVSNNAPIEQLIIEQLIAGPYRDGYQNTIPKETKVLKTSVKDGICYVNLNQAFLDAMPEVKDEITIYAIVNSLVDLPTVNKVQFTIDGKKMEKYREILPFDGIFERKLDLVESDK